MAKWSATLGAYDRRFALFVEATFNELAAVVACVSTPDITTSRLMPPASLVASAMSPRPGLGFCGANAVDAAHRIEDASTNR